MPHEPRAEPGEVLVDGIAISMAEMLDEFVGPAWRDWSDEAVGALGWFFYNCLEHTGYDNPPDWPVPFVRLVHVEPAQSPSALYRLRRAPSHPAEQPQTSAVSDDTLRPVDSQDRFPSGE